MNQQLENQETRRFVLLFHQFPTEHERGDHWDLMLEQGSSLATWSLQEMPEPGKSIPALRIADHRKLYLEYQGPVSGDRGSVTRVMGGEYFWTAGCEFKQVVLKFDGGSMTIELRGHGEQLNFVVT